MPICIECHYPVSQLYHILHSRNHKNAALATNNPTHKASTFNLAGASSSQKVSITTTTTTTSTTQKVSASNSKSTSIGGGSDVRLTQCPRCKRFADKYVEHDFVVLFIDLVLVKPQVSLVGAVRFLKMGMKLGPVEGVGSELV